MKNKPLLPLFFILLISFGAGAQGIAFQKGTWTEIKAKAKAENKHIFVDAYTTWCGPCKWQSKNVFPKKEVGDFFNKNFVAFKLDAEKGEGVAFAKQYKVKSYPTLLYFSPKGEIVHRTLGAFPAKKLLQQANRALNPETQLYPLKRRFEKGEKSQEFLKRYVIALADALADFSKPAEMYLNQMGKTYWTTAEGWEFISAYVRKSSDEVFGYVMKNQSVFAKAIGSSEKLGKKEVDQYIIGVLKADIQSVARSKDENRLAAFTNQLKAFGKKADQHIAKVEYMFYANDKDKAPQYASRYFDNYCNNALEFDRIAWQFHQKYDDPQQLEKALKWAEKSVQLMKGFFNMGTQAHLLFKLKRYKEAKKVTEEAIVLTKKAGKDIKGWADEIKTALEALLGKINAKL
ncbi:hypothetical protein BKI52_30160 [marine bacterium AO1-C]|nr:hypothetical protein BKI52_30160 [marine bacterium AO1-C]